jgi:flagellar motor switch/type III secretory pathway protein FliN
MSATSSFQSSSSSSEAEGASTGPFAWLADVPCRVDVVLGTCGVTVRDCYELVPGRVIRLQQAAGADLEVRAGGVCIATGEVLVVDDSSRLRITRILPATEAEGA